MEDLRHLRPTAWCYWQLVENKCSWGFVEAEFGSGPGQVKATVVAHPKYHVFCHFSHFLKPGMQMLNCTEPWVVAGFHSDTGNAAGVMMNAGAERCTLTMNWHSFATTSTVATVVIS